jgi:hypothetical protein
VRTKNHLAAKRDKAAAHIVLINILVDDPANGREALKFSGLFAFQLRGIENDPRTEVHPLQWRGFAMIGLDKSASQAALQVVFRGDNDPIMHAYSLILLLALYLHGSDTFGLISKTAGSSPAVF